MGRGQVPGKVPRGEAGESSSVLTLSMCLLLLLVAAGCSKWWSLPHRFEDGGFLLSLIVVQKHTLYDISSFKF